jgi:hypothetical protein
VGKQVCIEHLETDETGLAGKWGKSGARGWGWLPMLSYAHAFTCTYKHMQARDQFALRVGNKFIKAL